MGTNILMHHFLLQNRINKMLSVILFAVISLTTVSYAQTVKPLDQVAAIVNNEVITQSELNAALRAVQQEIAATQGTAPSSDALKAQVLNQLINQSIQLQMAKIAKIEATDSEVSRAISIVAQQNQMTHKALFQKLREIGINQAQYRKNIHDQIVIQKLQQQELSSKIVLKHEDVDDFIHYHKREMNEASQNQPTASKEQIAESLLLRQKFEEASKAWVSKLRGQAFIQIYES